MCKIDEKGKLKWVASEQIIYYWLYWLNKRTVQINNRCLKKITYVTLHINSIDDFERFVLNSLLLPLTNLAKGAITLCKSLCRTINILLQVSVCTYALLYPCPNRTNHINIYYSYMLAKSYKQPLCFYQFSSKP